MGILRFWRRCIDNVTTTRFPTAPWSASDSIEPPRACVITTTPTGSGISRGSVPVRTLLRRPLEQIPWLDRCRSLDSHERRRDPRAALSRRPARRRRRRPPTPRATPRARRPSRALAGVRFAPHRRPRCARPLCAGLPYRSSLVPPRCASPALAPNVDPSPVERKGSATTFPGDQRSPVAGEGDIARSPRHETVLACGYPWLSPSFSVCRPRSGR